MKKPPDHWLKRLQTADKPAYMLIADLIAEDVHAGRLAVRDKLPTLRELAHGLGLNYTTVARAYAQARKRGLIDTHVGIGTVVRGRLPGLPLRTGTGAAMTMNLPPEPALPALVQRMQDAAGDAVARHRDGGLYGLLRYQDFGGTAEEREAGVAWLRSHLPHCTAAQVLVCPGIHGTLLALMSQLARPGETVCVESLAYPGIKAIAAQLGIKLQALRMDEEGLLPEDFEHVCKTLYPRALICNPGIHNPTTATMSRARREAVADVALRYSVPIIEDDAYGKLIDTPLPTLMSMAPELTYYIGGLSKSLGAGLRLAYVCTPNVRMSQRLAGALRATSVMSSPMTVAVATRWIQTGLAQQMVEAIREESIVRQAMAARLLAEHDYQAHRCGFHLWLSVPEDAEAPALASALRNRGVPAVASVAFSTDADPPAALRLCLGGELGREEVDHVLRTLAEFMAHPRGPYEPAL